MLLEFRTSNFKSFKDELIFSLIPDAKKKGLDYSIIKKTIEKKEFKALCSSVIYGPNASGKTNVISALDVFKRIILRGNINDCERLESPNICAYSLDLIPNNTLKDSKPVSFSIKFIEDEYLFDYALVLDLGSFLEADYNRRIISESLYINSNQIFNRSDKLEIKHMAKFKELLIKGVDEHLEGVKAIASSNLNPKELFLMNGFKNMFSSKIALHISTWLNKKLYTICRADSIRFAKNIKENDEDKIIIESPINQAAKRFGINSNDIGFAKEDENNAATLTSFFNDKKTYMPAEFFESSGTIRFINMFPLIIDVLEKGGVLVVDEFDASIHPKVLMNIINIFHNDEININRAQLIFNTHNPIFLNSNLFRRDEIKFIERDENTHFSFHYSLSDFETVGTKNGPGVRNGEDYLNNYFINKYGAIRDIDLSDIIMEVLKSDKGIEDDED